MSAKDYARREAFRRRILQQDTESWILFWAMVGVAVLLGGLIWLALLVWR